MILKYLDTFFLFRSNVIFKLSFEMVLFDLCIVLLPLATLVSLVPANIIAK